MMMDNDSYTLGQLSLLRAIIGSVDTDIDYLMDEMEYIRKYGGAKARHIQDGRLEAYEKHRQRLIEARDRIEKQSGLKLEFKKEIVG